MFRGLYEHTINEKGRTSLPSSLREELAISVPQGSEERLIITTGIDRCLVAYPPAEWEAFEKRLAGLSQFDPAVVQLKRIYVAGATECSLDKHGRLLIPAMLREYAGLERDVVWAGLVTTIELWDKERWLEQEKSNRQDPIAIANSLKELGL
ncbi:division/cell wall cluster transcriptional repressor MraZ [Myxococcota bacterium]|nr:division/cell wall cluster transcriptional repressor MraZ [Myxococcota bacterium]